MIFLLRSFKIFIVSLVSCKTTLSFKSKKKKKAEELGEEKNQNTINRDNEIKKGINELYRRYSEIVDSDITE